MARKTRNTRQKGIIEGRLEDFDSFFTAEELLANARKKSKKIGIATIYRFLKEAENEGKLHSYLCGRRRVYSMEESSHCHFTCSKCGRSGHFRLKDISSIRASVEGKICHFQLDVTGVCGKCLLPRKH
ncbi:hypothetical protein AUJ17_05215 [Candidatus Micrarchaeota archaeon CG1_02_47_40]|nr:MAG: hypothetical protein AUJ17_05215 [Candidatus Micrarchaeota archaeon CG1_02_47_40]